MNKRLLIGVVTAQCHIDFQAETIKGIISQAFKSGCDIAVISSSHNFFIENLHRSAEKEIFKLILSDNIDGFIYDRNSFYGENIRCYIDDLLERSGKPVMLLDSGGHRKFESTAIDDCSAFEEITDHLIDVHGYREIYCLTGPKKQFVAEERLNGYRLSMKKHGLTVSKNSWSYGDFWHDAAQKLAQDIISGSIPRPEAIICGNDQSAIALIETLSRGGINVPEDIAVTGYDDSTEGRNYTPSVTSFRRPNFQLGSEAFRRLYRIITGKICTRVGNENVSLRLGESCGCRFCAPEGTIDKRRSAVIARNMTFFSQGDMLFDISSASDENHFADRIDNYTYLIYKMRRMYICLTRDFLESGNCRGFAAGGQVRAVLSKSATGRIYGENDYFPAAELLPVFKADRSYPVAYFITPLHCNGSFFGYSALSFGKEPITYDQLYIYWINYVNSALEHLRLHTALDRCKAENDRVLLRDERTGLLSRKGMEKRLAEEHGRMGSEIWFIRIQLSGIGKIYYSSGEEKFYRITSAFARLLKDSLADGEICGVWVSNAFGVITDKPDRAEELFGTLSEKLTNSRFACGEDCEIDFSVGVHSEPNSSTINLGSAMHRASVNRVFGYTISETGSNPQFEKLCQLRDKIAKNPEYPWNIGEIAEELYLSKSYLQKIYKSYFGKGIIEEMTTFRMDKARKLLSGTEMTVTEIARECGYSTYNYFVRRFKAEEGISPNEYRVSVHEINTNPSSTY